MNQPDRPTVVFVGGPPASGKTALAPRIAGNEVKILKTDDLLPRDKDGPYLPSPDSDIRLRFDKDPFPQEALDALQDTICDKAAEFLLAGAPRVAVESLFATRASREAAINRIKAKVSYYPIFLLCWKDESNCFSDNKRRSPRVPKRVITNYFDNFDPPSWDEGWHDIVVLYPFGPWGLAVCSIPWSYGVIHPQIDIYSNGHPGRPPWSYPMSGFQQWQQNQVQEDNDNAERG